MDKDLIRSALRLVVLLHNVVDVLRARFQFDCAATLPCGKLTVTAELTKRAKINATGSESARGHCDCGAEQRTNNVVVPGPNIDVDGVEDCEEG